MADIKKEHQKLKENLKKTQRVYADYLRLNRNKGGSTKVKDVASFERAQTAAVKKLDAFEKQNKLGRFALTGAEKRAAVQKKAQAFARASRAGKLTGRGGGGTLKMPQEYSNTALSKKLLR